MENNVLKYIQIKMIGDDEMFICLECGRMFEEPVKWVEHHGLTTLPYEHLSGSPCCYGGYTKAYKCDCCEEYIQTEDYIKTMDGRRYCEDCIDYMKLGEED